MGRVNERVMLQVTSWCSSAGAPIQRIPHHLLASIEKEFDQKEPTITRKCCTVERTLDSGLITFFSCNRHTVAISRLGIHSQAHSHPHPSSSMACLLIFFFFTGGATLSVLPRPLGVTGYERSQHTAQNSTAYYVETFSTGIYVWVFERMLCAAWIQ